MGRIAASHGGKSPSKWKNWYWIPIGVVVLIIILVAVRGDNSPEAVLIVDAGIVEIQTGSDWHTVTGKVTLSLNDRVRTQDGTATIILFDNLFTQLDPNSEVVVSELAESQVSLEQQQGSTWNKFIGLIGGQGASSRSPKVIAMVRGTEWGVDWRGLIVGEGTVLGEWTGPEGEYETGEQFSVGPYQILTILGDGTVGVRDLTAEERAEVLGRMGRTLEVLKRRRIELLEGKPVLVKTALKLSGLGLTLPEVLLNIDNGDLDYRPAMHKVPWLAKKFEKEVALTEKIIAQTAMMRSLRGMPVDPADMPIDPVE